MGKTIAVEPTNGIFVAPANGVIELLFPTGHAFAVRMNDGTGLLVHIGINTVELNGDGFKVYKKQGDKVSAGEKIVTVDLDKVKVAGKPLTTMTIITEPVEGKEYNFIDFAPVTRNQIIFIEFCNA